MISPYSVPCPLEEYLPPSGRKRKQSAELAMEAQAEAEQSGISLGSLLYSSQPGEKDSCSQDECNPFKRGHPRNCPVERSSGGVGLLLHLPHLW